MKPPPDTPEFARFTEALKDMLKVPKSEIDARVAAEKRKRTPKPSASRASGAASTSAR